MIAIIIMALMFSLLGVAMLIGLAVWVDNYDKELKRRIKHDDKQ